MQLGYLISKLTHMLNNATRIFKFKVST